MTVEVNGRELGWRVSIHAALADRHRLRIADRLSLSDLTPSELAEDLQIGSNLLAHHLGILESAGVIERLRSEGDGRRRYLRLALHPGELSVGGATIATDRLLFVCTGNSARSQLAAGLWNLVSGVPAESAGTHPADEVHPLAVRAGRLAGMELGEARPRGMDQVVGDPDLIVTVCDRAHEELGSLPDRTTVLHWWIPDPREIGTPAAFVGSLTQLQARVAALHPVVTPVRSRRSRRRTRP